MEQPSKYKPYRATIDATRGCNMKCDFCGVHSLPKKIVFMSMSTAVKAAKELSVFDPLRIEFGTRGEPTLNPKLHEITRAFRQYCPNSQITLMTNGTRLNEKYINRFFNEGGNIVLVDAYNKEYKHYFEKLKMFNPIDFYEDEFNPYHRHPPTTRKVCIIKDIGQCDGISCTRVLSNMAGNVDFELVKKYGLTPLKEPLEKMCTLPYRGLDIGYNGLICLCCNDWRQEMPLWDIKYGNLKEFWINNQKLNASRYLLYHKDRNFGICKRCDCRGGHRYGLVRKMGKYNESKMEYARKMLDMHHKKSVGI
jgi:hypothetical protein